MRMARKELVRRPVSPGSRVLMVSVALALAVVVALAVPLAVPLAVELVLSLVLALALLICRTCSWILLKIPRLCLS